MESTLSLSKVNSLSQNQVNFGVTSHDYHVVSVPTQHLSESTGSSYLHTPEYKKPGPAQAQK